MQGLSHLVCRSSARPSMVARERLPVARLEKLVAINQILSLIGTHPARVEIAVYNY